VRLPAARRFVVEHAINEVIDGDATDLRELGLIVQGGLTHTLLRAMSEAGMTDASGRPRLALLVLNCVYPLVPEQITAFCSGRSAVLVLEEGQPDYIEQDIATTLRRAGVATPLHGKDMLSMGGEYHAELLLGGLVLAVAGFFLSARPVQWTPYFWFLLTYATLFGTVLGWALWFYVLKLLPAGVAGLAVMAVPAIGVLSSRLQLGEQPGAVESAGMLLIVASLAVLSWNALRNRATARDT